jgi:hypothetical protein
MKEILESNLGKADSGALSRRSQVSVAITADSGRQS